MRGDFFFLLFRTTDCSSANCSPDMRIVHEHAMEIVKLKELCSRLQGQVIALQEKVAHL